MRLFTTACLLGSFILCLVLVWLFGKVEQPHQLKQQRLVVLQKMGGTTVCLMLTLVGAGAGSLLVVRRAKREYRELATRNMADLVEETRKTQNLRT